MDEPKKIRPRPVDPDKESEPVYFEEGESDFLDDLEQRLAFGMAGDGTRTWRPEADDRLALADPGYRQYLEDGRKYFIKRVSEKWKRIRHKGIENRAEWLQRVIDGTETAHVPVPPDWLTQLFDNHADEFTPKQRHALVLTYCSQFTEREAARHIGISRDSYHDRLKGAQRKARRLMLNDAGATHDWEIDERLRVEEILGPDDG